MANNVYHISAYIKEINRELGDLITVIQCIVTII